MNRHTARNLTINTASAWSDHSIVRAENSINPHAKEGRDAALQNANITALPLLLFASGVAALVYQIVWIKQLGLIVGVDVYAVTTAISAFFAGLGLGSFIFGRIADRIARPLRLYATLEVGVAVTGIAATYSLAHCAPLFVALQAAIGWPTWIFLFLLIGVPALFMGGTLPSFMRAYAPAAAHIGKTGGNFYAINTCGALCGALLTAFVLTPFFGVLGSAFAAAAINLSLSLIAYLSGHVPRRIVATAQKLTRVAPKLKSKALLIYAVAGGLALGYEVVWSQIILQFTSTRSFAFSIMLAIYLSGLVIGSAIYARYADRVRDAWGTFAILIAAAGLLALLQVASLGSWLPQLQQFTAKTVAVATDNLFVALCARFAVASFSLVFAPTLLLGAAFPLALRLVADERHIGSDIGAVIAFNTAGGIVGTFVVGFIFVPQLGLIHTLAVLAALAAAIGIYVVGATSDVHTNSRWSVAAIAAVVCFAAIATPSNRLAQLLTVTHPGNLIHYEESAGGTVAVIEQAAMQTNFRRLYIQGVSNSGDAMPSLRYMRLQALLPLLIQRDEPHSAMVIALGTGITAGALTQYPGLKKRVCVELLPAVVRAATLFSGNYNVTTDPQVDIRIRDGRSELLRSAERYDLITLEPPPPSAVGVVNLYSRDFYQLAKKRLQPTGLFAQWLPLATQNNEDTRALVRSFLDAFPYATLWTTELHEMLLIGSQQPIELDMQRISKRFNQPTVASALREVGIDSSAALLATWMMGRNGLEQYAGTIAAVTDDRPSIEYAAPLRRGEFARVLPQLLALRSNVPVRANPELVSDINSERELLLKFYSAGLDAYHGDRDAWSMAIGEVLEKDKSNVYYRWFIGG